MIQKQDGGISNSLKATRSRLGISQQQLAASAGVARQTIGGIEGGLYAPSAAIALRIARALGCRVEELFWLEDDMPALHAVMAGSAGHPDADLRVGLAHVGGTWVAHALDGEQGFRTEMVPADGIARHAPDGRMEVRCLDDPDILLRTVVVAG